jgi:Predicted Na+-dependent transporter
VMLLMNSTGGIHIDASVFGEIALQLLAPFILGQLLRPWVKNFAANKATKVVDRGSIAMVVYSAFFLGRGLRSVGANLCRRSYLPRSLLRRAGLLHALSYPRNQQALRL